MSSQAYLIIGLIVAIILIGAIAGFVLSRGDTPAPDIGEPEVDRDGEDHGPPGLAGGVAEDQQLDHAHDDSAQPVHPDVVDGSTVDEGERAGTGEHLLGAQDPAAIELPEPAQTRMTRLRSRLARSQTSLGRGLLAILSRDKLDDDAWEEIEDTLLTADVGIGPTQELVGNLRERVRVEGISQPDQARTLLREELINLVDPSMDRALQVNHHAPAGEVEPSSDASTGTPPAVVLVVGVNGTGKTTTVGRLARILVASGQHAVLGAADTFRAAATEQLVTWGERVGVPVIRGPEGSDPASVAYDAVKAGANDDANIVLVDTAGRLHTKSGLMDELGKIKRVIEKQAPVTEVLLVLDATTGQNGMNQARVFAEVVDVTGVVLTKLDGSAKGGIVVAVQRELNVPVKYVGLGEGPDDLAPFDPEIFVDALLD